MMICCASARWKLPTKASLPMPIKNGCFWYWLHSWTFSPPSMSRMLTVNLCRPYSISIRSMSMSYPLFSQDRTFYDETALGSDNSWRTRLSVAGLRNLADWSCSNILCWLKLIPWVVRTLTWPKHPCICDDIWYYGQFLPSFLLIEMMNTWWRVWWACPMTSQIKIYHSCQLNSIPNARFTCRVSVTGSLTKPLDLMCDP